MRVSAFTSCMACSRVSSDSGSFCLGAQNAYLWEVKDPRYRQIPCPTSWRLGLRFILVLVVSETVGVAFSGTTAFMDVDDVGWCRSEVAEFRRRTSWRFQTFETSARKSVTAKDSLRQTRKRNTGTCHISLINSQHDDTLSPLS